MNKEDNTPSPAFEPVSVPDEWITGAASGDFRPHELAKAIGLRVHGAWLAAYMLRRFGPPLAGSDDYKQLCTWNLTTPMKGLWLAVTPYLGDKGRPERTLSFAYRMNKAVFKKLGTIPRSQWKAYNASVLKAAQWALAKGVALWTPDKDGEECPREQVFEYKVSDTRRKECLVWSQPGDPRVNPEKAASWETLKKSISDNYLWDMRQAYCKAHPDEAMPLYPHCNEAFKAQCEAALTVTLQSLQTCTRVRDIYFAPWGRVKDDDGTPYAKPHERSGYPMQWQD